MRGAVPRASVDAEPAPTTKARPAVVLMPGWGYPMALSTALAQDLASNGYVVVAVDPTFGTEDQNTLPADTANPHDDSTRSRLHRLRDRARDRSVSPDRSTRQESQSAVTPSPAPSRSKPASPTHACTQCSTSTDGSTDPR